MKITWSVPVPGATVASGRGDLVRAAQLAAALRALGHDVVLVHAADQPRTAAAVSTYRTFVRRLLPARAALTIRDVGRTMHAGAHARRVARAARAQGADLIIETQVHLSESGTRAARACGIPLLLDDCSPPGEEVVLGGGVRGLARYMFARQVRGAARVTVSSAALRERLIADGVPPRKLAVVPNGVDLDAHAQVTRETARRRLGLGSGVVLAFVGSFQPWHRVELLVAAMSHLTPPPRLLLAGEGPGLAPALKVAQQLGIGDLITSLGPLPPAEIPGVLAAADIGVLPDSNDYGQPMKLLEYAAAGLAIIAANRPPVRDLVEHERTALLVPPGNADTLRDALERLLLDPALRQRLAECARAQVAPASGWRQRGAELAAVAAAALDLELEPRVC